jgi:hypothetical protein
MFIYNYCTFLLDKTVTKSSVYHVTVTKSSVYHMTVTKSSVYHVINYRDKILPLMYKVQNLIEDQSIMISSFKKVFNAGLSWAVTCLIISLNIYRTQEILRAHAESSLKRLAFSWSYITFLVYWSIQVTYMKKVFSQNPWGVFEIMQFIGTVHREINSMCRSIP